MTYLIKRGPRARRRIAVAHLARYDSVPVHHKRGITAYWAVCESCYPGRAARATSAVESPRPVKLAVVRESA